MKVLFRNLTSATAALTVLILLSPSQARAEEEGHKDDHKHEHHAIAGPNGGKVLHEVEPHAELFVTKDRKIQMTFLKDDGKALAPEAQTISVICGKRTAPTRMTFAKEGNSFLSDKALPEGLNIPTVIQIKMTPKSKAKTIRLNLNLEDCPSCDHLEYACTCDHHHEDDHDHKKEKK